MAGECRVPRGCPPRGPVVRPEGEAAALGRAGRRRRLSRRRVHAVRRRQPGSSDRSDRKMGRPDGHADRRGRRHRLVAADWGRPRARACLEMPAIRALSIAFIELWRGVPMITVLFMAAVMLPLFLPDGMTLDKLARALIGVSLFAGAYMAEVVRGGLQAMPRGQSRPPQRWVSAIGGPCFRSFCPRR